MPDRYVPDEPFPPYAYVPGHWPHPENDPEGHAFDDDESPLDTPLDPDDWRSCREYLFGIDLFNHGYYWEAHESWERLWHAAGRSGLTADFLRALIKFAAAGVKIRQGNERGLDRHAEKAVRQFEQLTDRLESDRYAGLVLDRLIDRAKSFRDRPPPFDVDPEEPVQRVLPWVLQPGDE